MPYLRECICAKIFDDEQYFALLKINLKYSTKYTIFFGPAKKPALNFKSAMLSLHKKF